MTIPANETSISSTITPIKDNLVEPVETLSWTLYSNQGTYNLGADVLAEMSIVDDPVEVTLTLDDGEMDEAALGTGKFTVTRSANGKPDAALPVFFTFGGTASNGGDYTAADQGYAGPIHRQMTIPANGMQHCQSFLHLAAPPQTAVTTLPQIKVMPARFIAK